MIEESNLPRDILQLSNFSLFFSRLHSCTAAPSAHLSFMADQPICATDGNARLLCIIRKNTAPEHHGCTQPGRPTTNANPQGFFLTVYILLNITCPQTENPV